MQGTTGNTLIDFLERVGKPAANHRPWPRYDLTPEGWLALIETLGATDWILLGLWGDHGKVHAALRNESGTDSTIAVATLACPTGHFPSISTVRPSANRLERAAADLYGLIPDWAVDGRRWLDHGVWGLRQPQSLTPTPSPIQHAPYQCLPVEGKGLHEIPVGPVHAGIIEPGHFRFTANGETVVRLEERLGYVHKGIEDLMKGRTIADAARLAARLSGDATVAHSLAFAMAVESALGVTVPPRAIWLRALMAELERIANHLGDIGAVCNDAAFAFMLAQTSQMREAVLRTTDTCFGHRLMMDVVVPGGITTDLPDKSGPAAIQGLIEDITRRFAPLVEIYENKSSLQDRTLTTGFVSPSLVRRFGAGGHVGRASGRAQDARCLPGYAPYDRLNFEIPVFLEGDVDARVRVRIREIEQSLGMLSQILSLLPGGEILVPVRFDPDSGAESAEGMALVESFRGEILTWVRVGADSTVERCHPRDPSWFQWPLLEVAIEGNIVADFPLCNKSFNCSYSGHDL